MPTDWHSFKEIPNCTVHHSPFCTLVVSLVKKGGYKTFQVVLQRRKEQVFVNGTIRYG